MARQNAELPLTARRDDFIGRTVEDFAGLGHDLNVSGRTRGCWMRTAFWGILLLALAKCPGLAKAEINHLRKTWVNRSEFRVFTYYLERN